MYRLVSVFLFAYAACRGCVFVSFETLLSPAVSSNIISSVTMGISNKLILISLSQKYEVESKTVLIPSL